MDARLSEVGEDGVVAALIRGLPQGQGVIVGPGDDCAVLETADPHVWQLFKTDCVVEGVHFLPGEKPEAVGWKAMARAVSDMAAMGGRPTSAVVTLVTPVDRSLQWARGLYRGFRKAGRAHDFSLVGGETSSLKRGGPVMINVAMLGTVEADRCVLRSGGNPGDLVLVTGRLGGSLAGWHLSFQPRVEAARWLGEHFLPTAMMDLSDGLAQDLPRLAKASGTGWHIDPEGIPRNKGCTTDQALRDGEDYELLLTQPPDHVPALLEKWRACFPRLPLTVVGRLTAKKGGNLTGRGFDHFG